MYGRVTIKCELKGKFYAVNFEVLKQEVQSILGLQTYVAMNLMQHLDVNDTKLLDSYSDAFEGLGCIYNIKVDKSYQPVFHSPRRVPVT